MFARRILPVVAAWLSMLPTAMAEPDDPSPLQLSQRISLSDASDITDSTVAPTTPATTPAPYWPPAAAPDLRDDLPPVPTLDLTTPPADLWQRIRNGFGMADLSSPLVADRLAGREPTVPFTLEEELATNPFLRCRQAAVATAAERRLGRRPADELEVFTALRKWRDSF